MADIIAAGTRILIVEDEPALCRLLEAAVGDGGAVLIGPVADIEEGLRAITEETVDVAILDLIVSGTYSYPLAEALQARGIPFAFTTGLGPDRIDPRFRDVPTITKPFLTGYVVEVIIRLVDAG